MKNLLNSKKAQGWQWYEIVMAILAIAGLIIFIYMLATGTLKFGKSTGCTGAPKGYTGTDTLFCTEKGETCPEGSSPTSETSWSYFSGGCGIGKICCFGEKDGATGSGGKGVLNVKSGSEIVSSTITIIKGQSTELNVQGTEDVKSCSVELNVPLKDGKTKIIEIIGKDTACSKTAAKFSITAGNEENADTSKDYTLKITGYNTKKELIKAKNIAVTVKETASDAEGTGTDSAENTDEIIFKVYNYNFDAANVEDIITEIAPNQVYSTNNPSVAWSLKCSGKYEGCEMFVSYGIGDPAKMMKLMIEGQPGEKEGNGNYAMEKEGNYLFFVTYKEDGKDAYYGTEYQINYQKSGTNANI